MKNSVCRRQRVDKNQDELHHSLIAFHLYGPRILFVLQSQRAVTAYLKLKHLLPFGFGHQRYRSQCIGKTHRDLTADHYVNSTAAWWIPVLVFRRSVSQQANTLAQRFFNDGTRRSITVQHCVDVHVWHQNSQMWWKLKRLHRPLIVDVISQK